MGKYFIYFVLHGHRGFTQKRLLYHSKNKEMFDKSQQHKIYIMALFLTISQLTTLIIIICRASCKHKMFKDKSNQKGPSNFIKSSLNMIS